MTELLQQLINGLALGAIYALIALGYTMVYGVLRFINFAHSDVFMVGAFCRLLPARRFAPQRIGGRRRCSCCSAPMAICALLGMIIEKLAYRPLRGRSTLTVLITAIGVSLLLRICGQRIFGANPKSFPTLFPLHYFKFDSGLVIASTQILVFVVTIILLFALRYIVLQDPDRHGHARAVLQSGGRLARGHQQRPRHLLHLRPRLRAGRGRRHPLRHRTIRPSIR